MLGISDGSSLPRLLAGHGAQMHVLVAAALFVLDFDNNSCRISTWLSLFLSPNNEQENAKLPYESWRCSRCDVLIRNCCVDARNPVGPPQLNTVDLDIPDQTAMLDVSNVGLTSKNILGHQLALLYPARAGNIFLVPRPGHSISHPGPSKYFFGDFLRMLFWYSPWMYAPYRALILGIILSERSPCRPG